MKNVLVTGGAGYIGSHTVKKLIKNGYKVIVIDDLSTGCKSATGGSKLVVGDFADTELLDKIITEYKPAAAIHFAASKDAPESVIKPDKYFYNNTAKTIIFLNKLLQKGIKNLIFSSTAAVYGDVQSFPITEDFPIQPSNPYAESKAMIEKILLEYQKTLGLRPVILRYFNAGGADPEHELGNMYPDPKDVISVLMNVASSDSKKFNIFGSDYETRDGTCIRDIIHVDDLAEAHVLALGLLINKNKTGIYNLGSEEGFTIREIVNSTKKVTKKEFNVVEAPRREGDIVVSIASSSKAKKELGWKPKYTIENIIETAYKWRQSQNR